MKRVFLSVTMVLIFLMLVACDDSSSASFVGMRLTAEEQEEGNEDEEGMNNVVQLSNYKEKSDFSFNDIEDNVITDLEDNYMPEQSEDEESDYYLENEKATLEIEIDNPDGEPITRFSINGENKYIDPEDGIIQKSDELIEVRVDLDPDEKVNVFTLDGVWMGDGPIEFDDEPEVTASIVKSDVPALVEDELDIESTTKDSATIDYQFVDSDGVFDDENNTARIYLHDGDEIVDSKEIDADSESVTFDDLDPATSYAAMFGMIYSQNDGEGYHASAVYENYNKENFMPIVHTETKSDISASETTKSTIELDINNHEELNDEVDELVLFNDEDEEIDSVDILDSTVVFEDLEKLSEYYVEIKYSDGETERYPEEISDKELNTKGHTVTYDFFNEDYFKDNFRMDQDSVDNHVPDSIKDLEDVEATQELVDGEVVLDMPTDFDISHENYETLSEDEWHTTDGNDFDEDEELSEDQTVVYHWMPKEVTFKLELTTVEFLESDYRNEGYYYDLFILGETQEFYDKEEGERKATAEIKFYYGEYIQGKDLDIFNEETVSNSPSYNIEKLENSDYDSLETILTTQDFDSYGERRVKDEYSKEYYDSEKSLRGTKYIPEGETLYKNEKLYLRKDIEYVLKTTNDNNYIENYILPHHDSEHPEHDTYEYSPFEAYTPEDIIDILE
ncbi:MAG: hypothetical protein ACOCQD_05375 [archaeon]